jgi:hypothetical protein
MNKYNDPKGHAGSLKTPLGLIPPTAMEQVAWAHKLGADKYGPWNWRKTGVCASTYVNAILRHLNAWRDGEDLDPESGFSHLAHIACSCNILMDAAKVGKLQDDRNKLPTNGEVEEDSPVNNMTDEEFERIIASLRSDMEDFGYELSIDDVPEPDTVPEYRILKVGELIQEGDELYNEFDNEWIETTLLTSDQIGVDNNTIYRRKITDCDLKGKVANCDLKDDVPEPDTVPEYRVLLREGDKLQDGDEVYVGEDHWLPVYVSDWMTPAVVRNGTYRRKITDCDLKEKVADCDLKRKPADLGECTCGRRYIYHWLYGWICEDCEIKYNEPY